MNTDKKLPFPDYDPALSDDQYRAKLRAWFDSGARDPDEGPGFAKGSWEYICELAGIPPYGK